ncbi:glycosyltransferase family 4 protein [Flavobacterium sp. 102]|uniref:glycosyltransferase family 4 protein n=1 Tax=Flavobacterium sp. 102 TaxID=2135623 RepID=UPI000EB2FE49|nr:glycosyltransferase [Flavobacterium sp. 102]RKS01917.1 glycosyltransferase involved in cell wall biosynthesis [Flavobacterium sp. 102]
MTFCIITHVAHGFQNGAYFAYSPYVREMNIWSKYVDKVILVAPLNLKDKTAIDIGYNHQNIEFRKVASYHFLSLKSTFQTLFKLPQIVFEIYKAMKQSDHIHLRCPGNMGLLGCLVQILFPGKPKTAKYAGNWDVKAKQPLSYRLQKWLLSNTFLTKKMQVLVYGEWENSTKNIKPFFTASYFEKDKIDVRPRTLEGKIYFVFVGTLSNGKQPLYAIELVEQLYKKGYDVQLTIFGEGIERKEIENYIVSHSLENIVFLKGNQSQETIKQAYLENHFVVLPSLSEGWPKVVAEGMFWGCLPIASKVSCVPNMLENGNRGLLLELKLEHDVTKIESILKDNKLYQEKVNNAIQWSRRYTLDVFETEIKQLLQS